MKKDKTIYAVIIITLFASVWSVKVNTTNYYIANNGDDTANGTSPATAWKTIGHVNLQTFNPGDSILFKCGDRWMEYFIVPSSGNAGNYITFTSYGTGARPKLYGSTPRTSFSGTNIITIPVNLLKPGVYFVTLSDGVTIFDSEKLIIY